MRSWKALNREIFEILLKVERGEMFDWFFVSLRDIESSTWRNRFPVIFVISSTADGRKKVSALSG